MIIYRFKPAERSDQRVALTVDASGANLPGDGAPWQAIGQVDLDAADPWIKVPRADIEAALQQRGFFLWGIRLPPQVPRFAAPPQG